MARGKLHYHFVSFWRSSVELLGRTRSSLRVLKILWFPNCLFPPANLRCLGGIPQGTAAPPHTQASHGNYRWHRRSQAPGLESVHCWAPVLCLLFRRHAKPRAVPNVLHGDITQAFLSVTHTKKYMLYYISAHVYTHTHTIVYLLSIYRMLSVKSYHCSDQVTFWSSWRFWIQRDNKRNCMLSVFVKYIHHYI